MTLLTQLPPARSFAAPAMKALKRGTAPLCYHLLANLEDQLSRHLLLNIPCMFEVPRMCRAMQKHSRGPAGAVPNNTHLEGEVLAHGAPLNLALGWQPLHAPQQRQDVGHQREEQAQHQLRQEASQQPTHQRQLSHLPDARQIHQLVNLRSQNCTQKCKKPFQSRAMS